MLSRIMIRFSATNQTSIWEHTLVWLLYYEIKNYTRGKKERKKERKKETVIIDR